VSKAGKCAICDLYTWDLYSKQAPDSYDYEYLASLVWQPQKIKFDDLTKPLTLMHGVNLAY
jgi:hypothetical protein